jgi:predicted ATPase/DNA-binding SARP family transcriptional activator
LLCVERDSSLSNKLEVKLLGKFEVSRDGKPIAITSRPAQSLFAYLILSAGTSHRREKLAGMLWPDSLEETARDNLRHALWRIRKALPSQPKVEYLLADDLSIAFNASAEYWLDATELEKLSETASADELIAVLSTYQGELLPGFYDEWVMLEREHLSSVFEHKTARLMSLLQNENRWLDILEWGERWIKLGQRPEPAYRALMSAHAAKGDMSKVAATYERCVKSLKGFGMEPSEQTRALYERLKAGKETLETASTVRVIDKRRESPKTNLPVPLTSFIGREKEVDQITRLLGKNRLVTLTGSGGVGKTRLAIQSARDSIKKFKDAVCWVELVGLQDGSLIPQEIAQALDVREVSNQPMMETLKTHLKSKGLLLVLDNCEHLIEACAQTVEGLLAACPKLKILATSRERLDLFNETTWNVPSLPLPEMQQALSLKQLKEFASIQLFVERARNVKSDFVLTEQNASSIAQICNRLDGIPLAIELASARIKLLSVDEIASRLSDRFSLLTSGTRTALPRQQTLRAAIDWSHDLLTEPERILFRRLAVFPGGFTLEAAETVCSQGMKQSDILDLLAHLVDKSLVIVEADSEVGETRYHLLETIRQYALEKLVETGEAPAIRDGHLEFFVRLAEETEPHLYAPDQIIWFNRADAEIDNMRAALDWSTTDMQDGNTEHRNWRMRNGLQLAGVLAWFWQRGYSRELAERLEYILSSPLAKKPILERARALNTMGLLQWTLADFSAARMYLEEALAIGRQYNDKLTLSWSLSHLGNVFVGLRELNSAQPLLEEAVEVTKDLPGIAKTIRGYALGFLGDIPLMRNDNAGAMLLYEESAKLLRETHNLNMLAYAIRRLGYLALKQNEYKRAKDLFKESLISNLEVGHQLGVAAAMAGLAELALEEGEKTRAAQLYGIVENKLASISLSLNFFVTDETEFNRGIAALQAQLDEKTLARHWAKGKAMPPDDVIAFALEWT